MPSVAVCATRGRCSIAAIKSNHSRGRNRSDPTVLDRAVVCIASLSAFDNRVTLVDPVSPKILSEIKSLYVRKPERAQLLVSGFNIRATTPGTAPAIEDDQSVLVEAGDTRA